MLSGAAPPALRVSVASPQWTQSVGPSALRFTAAPDVVTLPASAPPPPPPAARLVSVKVAGVAMPATLAVTP